MKEIRKVVELFTRKEERSQNNLVSLRVYYTDDSYETIQVKKDSEKYEEYMRIAHPDRYEDVVIDEDENDDDSYGYGKSKMIKESAIPRYTSVAMVLAIIAVLLVMAFKEFLK